MDKSTTAQESATKLGFSIAAAGFTPTEAKYEEATMKVIKFSDNRRAIEYQAREMKEGEWVETDEVISDSSIGVLLEDKQGDRIWTSLLLKGHCGGNLPEITKELEMRFNYEPYEKDGKVHMNVRNSVTFLKSISLKSLFASFIEN